MIELNKIVQRLYNELVEDYPNVTALLSTGVFQVGRKDIAVRLSQISSHEVRLFIDDVVVLAKQSINEDMQIAILKSIPLLLDVYRVQKKYATQEYGGQSGVGVQSCVTMLVPWHIGNESLTNSDDAARKGIYESEYGSLTSWLHTFSAGCHYSVFPAQILSKDTAIVHIGIADSVRYPKILGVQHELYGIRLPIQIIDLKGSCIRNNQEIIAKLLPHSNETNSRLLEFVAFPSFVAFPKPVVVLPGSSSAVEFFADSFGEGRPQLVSILITSAQNLTRIN